MSRNALLVGADLRRAALYALALLALAATPAAAQLKGPSEPVEIGKSGAGGASGGFSQIADFGDISWAFVVSGDALVVTNAFGSGRVRSTVVMFDLAAPTVRLYELESPSAGVMVSGGSAAPFQASGGAIPVVRPETDLALGDYDFGPWRLSSGRDDTVTITGPDGVVYSFWTQSNGWFRIEPPGQSITIFNNGFFEQVSDVFR